MRDDALAHGGCLTLVVGMLASVWLVLAAAPAEAQDFELPIRWCAVAGSPAVTNPGFVGETNTDGVLWRRQERLSDRISIPQAGVTWRSAIIADVTGPGNFPVVADQNTAVGNAGDMINPGLNATEYNATVNACVGAWDALLPAGVGSDLGVVALNVNRVVNTAGTPMTTLGTVAGAGFGQRRLILQDAAYTFAGSPVATGIGFDAAESTLGHEIAHSLPTQLSPPTSTVGLRHACATSTFNTNLMSPTLGDIDGDNIWEQTLLGTSVQQAVGNGPDGNHCTSDDVFETLDQVTTLRQTAPSVPGCRLFGTATACSTLSDIAADDVGEIDNGGLDVSLVSVTDPEEREGVDFAIETFLPIDEETFASGAQFLMAADLDDDAETGLAPSDQGVPIGFQGAELLLSGELAGENELAVRAFVAEDGEWVERQRLTGLVSPNQSIVEVFEPEQSDELREITSHTVSWQVDPVLLEPLSETLRLTAVTRESAEADEPPLDDLGADDGVRFGLGPAEFPTCQVTPDPAPAGGLAEAAVEGLLPERGVHALIGPDEAGTGMTDAQGSATVTLRVPADSPGRTRLVTVGVDGTALTADCPMEVDAEASTAERHAGADRIGTAAEISRRTHPQADTVVVARADEYADALAGAPLATELGAPVLLTSTGGLHPTSAEEVERLAASEAVLLGGQAALSGQVADDLADLGLTVRRVGGTNRFDTARLISEQLPETDEVYIAEGVHADPARGWPDALSAAGAAAGRRAPVLLVARDLLPPSTVEALSTEQDAVIVGGTAAVSQAVEAAVDEHVQAVRRLAGPNRYVTATEVANDALDKGANPAVTWVATGRDWPDALVAAAATGHVNGVLTLVDGQELSLSPSSRDWIDDNAEAIRSLRMAGGTAAISETTRDELAELLGP